MSTNPWMSPNLVVDPYLFFKKIHHVFHTGESMVHGPSHINFWLPYFESVIDETLLLVRNKELYDWIVKEQPRCNVAYAKNFSDIDSLIPNFKFIKNMYYSSNTGNTIHTLKYNEIKHVFLGHGDSDKSASAHKYFRVYDEIWVSGQAHIDRFKNAGFDINTMVFKKVGRPALRKALSLNKTLWHERMDLSFLYLPTWEGVYEEGNYSSVSLSKDILTTLYTLKGAQLFEENFLETEENVLNNQKSDSAMSQEVLTNLENQLDDQRIDQITDVKNLDENPTKIAIDDEILINKESEIENILSDSQILKEHVLIEDEVLVREIVNVSAKFHPVTGSRDRNLKNIKGELSDFFKEDQIYIAEKSEPVDSLILKANAFICDISAVVSECLALDGPIFVYIPKDKEILISRSDMIYEDYCYTFSNITELKILLNRVILEKDDYLACKRKEAIEYILSEKETEDMVFEQLLQEASLTNSHQANLLSVNRQ